MLQVTLIKVIQKAHSNLKIGRERGVGSKLGIFVV